MYKHLQIGIVDRFSYTKKKNLLTIVIILRDHHKMAVNEILMKLMPIGRDYGNPVYETKKKASPSSGP